MTPVNRADVTPDTPIPASHLIQEAKEQKMTRRAMSLMDVLAPPGNAHDNAVSMALSGDDYCVK